MKTPGKFSLVVGAVCALCSLSSFGASGGAAPRAWFPTLDVGKLQPDGSSLWLLQGFQTFQQTTDYTCGPALLLSVAHYLSPAAYSLKRESEMLIAKEAGTVGLVGSKEKGGTSPQKMVAWLTAKGFRASLSYEKEGDGSALERTKENLKKGNIVLAEIADLGGHWVAVVGFDNRGNSNPWDDVVILADPYDRYDDIENGFLAMNANRFYFNWFDPIGYGPQTWRPMIVVSGKNG